MTCEELIKELAERYDALSALADDGSLAIEVDDTPVSFRKANGAVAVVARVCEMPGNSTIFCDCMATAGDDFASAQKADFWYNTLG